MGVARTEPNFGADAAAVCRHELPDSASRTPRLSSPLWPPRPARAAGLGRGAIWAAAPALLLTLGLSPAATANPTSASPGNVRFVKVANSAFDRYTRNPTTAQQQWMRAHYWRMLTYAPYFDSRLSWFPDAWTYKDLYAIYRGSTVAQQHPEWILRDASGNALYIPFGCSAGSCPQYAGDVGNPAFRSNWVSGASATLAKGYRGLFIDDVNMTLAGVGNGAGQPVVPTDPRTGRPMTESDWRGYMAAFTEQVRSAFPRAEIVHNAIWFLGHSDADVQRELLSADLINLERGINDSGLRGGGGTYGLETLFSHIDWLHGQGRGVVFDAKATTDQGRAYGLAGYYLVSSGGDGLSNDPGGTPDDWWSGYDVFLGDALGSRYSWSSVLRRDFQSGLVLLNEPDASSRTIQLGGVYADLGGNQVSSVTLGPAEGTVLRNGTATPSTSTTSTTPSTTTTMPPPACAPTPETGCESAASHMGSLLLKKGLAPSTDTLGWRWVSNGVVPKTDLGDPTTTTGYVFCLYDNAGLQLTAHFPAGTTCAGKPCWTTLGTTGFKFRDQGGMPDGLTSAVLKAGGARAARIKLGGKGANLHLPTLPLGTPVRVQLSRSGAAACWEAVYSTAIANGTTVLKAKSD